MAVKEYTLQDKQSVLRDALRRMEPVHLHWQMLESLYRTGAQREITQLDLNRILPFPIPGAFLRTVNMLLPHLTLIINSVAARDPKFVVTPIGGDPEVVEKNGTVAKAVLDYFWRRAEATHILRDMTQDMVVIGNGFAKVGWAYTEETVDRLGEDVILEAEDLVAAATEISQEMGQDLDQATISEIVESVAMTEQRVEVDEPYVEYVSPYDIFVPADARRMNQVRWVAQRMRLPKSEVEENQMFDAEARRELKVDTGYADLATITNYEAQVQELPAAFAYVTIYEFYDMKARTLTVFELDGAKPLYHGEIPYAHRYPPFVHMRNFSDGGSTFWGFGDVENVAGMQLMINEIMVAEINDLKRVGNKYFINKKVLTPELAKALAENKPDGVIPIDLPPNTTINEVMIPVQRLATPADNFVMENKLQGYVQQVLGISDLQMGTVSTASRVPATAAAAVEGAATTRSLDKMTNVEKASREIATRMLGLCQQFLDEGKAVRIAGANAPMWLNVTPEDIEGEFSIEAEGGSTQAINPASRARQGLEMLANVIPTLANLGYDPTPALRTALGYMGLNPDHLLVRPEPQPMSPEMGAPAGPGGVQPPAEPAEPASPADMMAQSPELNNEMLAQLAAMGGSPIPAAGTGEVTL